MTIARAKKGILSRHPFLFGIAAAVIAAIIFLPKSPEHEYKKLDYSKPIYTDDLAIICPKSLLFDLRADHDAHAIFEVFTAFIHRDEKAKALGCDVVRGHIPVKAERMLSPFDDYLSVNLSGVQGEFFTSESELKNGTSEEDSSQTSVQPTLEDARAIERSNFEKRLPSLDKPMANLRWLPVPALNPRPDKQEDAELFTPYGPCAVITGNVNRTGYVVMKMNQTGLLGGYDVSKAIARETAQEYCHEWYSAEARKQQSSAQIGSLWFKPDPEDQSMPTAEGTTATPIIDVAPNAESLSHAPAPIVRVAPPPAPTENFTWQTEPNGDQVLAGSSSGKCATIALLSAHDPLNRLHVTFSDGSTVLYSIEETSDAMQAARNYCRTGNRLVEGAP